eukprot:6500754-Ditylum_brightwellii.AAC.2
MALAALQPGEIQIAHPAHSPPTAEHQWPPTGSTGIQVGSSINAVIGIILWITQTTRVDRFNTTINQILDHALQAQDTEAANHR